MTDLDGWAGEIADLRADFAAEATSLGLSVTESAANWVLLEDVDASLFRLDLARQGIIVRDCSNFGLSTTVRIALPQRADLDRVITALATTVCGSVDPQNE